MRLRDTDKQQLVKEKAIELVVNEGLEGFSVNKLAKACGISVATLYIYYKDKDDLLKQIAAEEAKRMGEVFLEDFDPQSRFEEGLRQQWKNRAKHMLENPMSMKFIEQLRSSSYHEVVYDNFVVQFKEAMSTFVHNAVKRGEIDQLPVEVYWSIAFAPLNTLVRFHNEGKSVGGKKFKLADKTIWQTFDLVIKALKK